MICPPCRDALHLSCENTDRLGVAIPPVGQYCDCQHEPRDAM
jgi:hypothetical protein